MTDNDIRLIKNLWESGYTVEQIVRMLPYTGAEARAMIKELRRNGTIKMYGKTDAAIEKLVNAYRNGMTDPRDLAETFGYTLKTVLQYLKLGKCKHGHPKTQYNPKPLGEKALEIMRVIKQGKLSMAEIARKYGVSRQYVYQLKERLEKADG